MANKRAKQRKPKQNADQKKTSGQKGGAGGFDETGSPSPVKKNKKK